MSKYTSAFNIVKQTSYLESLLLPNQHFFGHDFLSQHTYNLEAHIPDNIIPTLPDQEAVKTVQQNRLNTIQEMLRKYPEFSLFHMKVIGYRLDSRPPEAIAKQGGFFSKDPLWITTKTDAPNNKGLVGFSLLPGVTCLFMENRPEDRDYYIYAIPVDIGYAMKGEWRQIVIPSLSLPKWWCAKPIEEIQPDGTVTLGKSQGHHGEVTAAYDEQFNAFLQGGIQPPKCIDYGNEDYEPMFDIKDSTLSREFERIRKEKAQSQSISI